MVVSHFRLAFMSSYMRSSFSRGSAASASDAAPRVGMSCGGRKLTASPAFQLRLPPGPAVARLMLFSNLPPVSPSALTLPSNGDPHAETTAPVAPVAPMSLSSVRRSTTVRVASDMCVTPSRNPVYLLPQRCRCQYLRRVGGRGDAASLYMKKGRFENRPSIRLIRTASLRVRSLPARPGGVARAAGLSQLPHIRFELVVLVFHGVEEQALEQIGAPIFVGHLVDEVGDLAHHVLERPVEPALGGDLAIEGLHDRQQIAVEQDFSAGRRRDGPHG